jgi:hypothetical protein
VLTSRYCSQALGVAQTGKFVTNGMLPAVRICAAFLSTRVECPGSHVPSGFTVMLSSQGVERGGEKPLTFSYGGSPLYRTMTGA